MIPISSALSRVIVATLLCWAPIRGYAQPSREPDLTACDPTSADNATPACVRQCRAAEQAGKLNSRFINQFYVDHCQAEFRRAEISNARTGRACNPAKCVYRLRNGPGISGFRGAGFEINYRRAGDKNFFDIKDSRGRVSTYRMSESGEIYERGPLRGAKFKSLGSEIVLTLPR